MYVALFAVYVIDGDMRRALLGVSPLNEGSQTAEFHEQLMANVLGVYKKTLDMVVFLIGDNCSTNQALATRMGVL